VTIEHSEREGGAMVMLKRLLYEESGQGMVEYGLIIALVAIALIAVLGALGGGLKGKFNEIVSQLGGTPVQE
jgi:pilus assembly protein Flp/PilA